MRGLTLLGDCRAEVRDFPVPEPGPGELRFRVESAGLCGSDLHFYRSTPAALGVRLGVVIGHEPCGTIDRVGTGTTGLEPGDRVTVNHTLGCGRCPWCLGGETQMCSESIGMAAAGRGGDAGYVVVPARNAFALPPGISCTDGSFVACAGATAYGALLKAAPRGGSTLAVFGLGPVGLAACLLGRAFGARVVGLDVLPARRDLAARLLGVEALDASADPVRAVRELTGGRGADGAVETSGAAAAQAAAPECVVAQGIVVYVGLSSGAPSISPESLIHREIRVAGSKVLAGRLVPDMLRFLAETRVSFECLVTEEHPLEKGPEALARFDQGIAGKVVLRP
jgi:(R,R)-butanediol dehydrogenase / meso-butanediol dehydrogenase / diacetyl reductase